MKLVKTSSVIKKIYPKYIWDIPTTEKAIYLTFDDGPTPEVTPWVLKVLKEFSASATFFCIGRNVVACPEIFDQIRENGHGIGNHTYSHFKGWDTATEQYLEDVSKCQEIVNSRFFRPPYGKILRKQGRLLLEEYQVIMWDVLTYDYEMDLKVKDILRKIIDATSSGSIVVYHDSVKSFDNLKKMLPVYLEHFSKQGYQFKALDVNLSDEIH